MTDKKKSTQSTRGRSKSKTAKPKKVNPLLPKNLRKYEIKGLKVKIKGDKTDKKYGKKRKRRKS